MLQPSGSIFRLGEGGYEVVDEDGAKAFNVRKNRERGNIDAIKFGKILYEEHEKGATLSELAKKYGYSNKIIIWEYIDIYRNRDKIQAYNDRYTPISRTKALRVLRELKKKRGKKKKGG